MVVVAVTLASLAVVGLIVIAIVTAFARLGLETRKQPLGLPRGSVRALIALLLVVMFGVFAALAISCHVADAALVKQVLDVIGTLMVSMSGFYFGSRTAEGAANRLATPAQSASVTSATLAGTSLTIVGTGLNTAKTVELVQGTLHVAATVVALEPTKITATVDLSAQPKGAWAVVVTFNDGSILTKPGAIVTI